MPRTEIAPPPLLPSSAGCLVCSVVHKHLGSRAECVDGRPTKRVVGRPPFASPRVRSSLSPTYLQPPPPQILIRTGGDGDSALLDVACVSADGRLLGRLSASPAAAAAAPAPAPPQRAAPPATRAALAAALTLPDRAASALARTSARCRLHCALCAWRAVAALSAADRAVAAARAEAAAARAEAAAARADAADAGSRADADCADADRVGALMATLLREAHPSAGSGVADLLSGGRRAEAARALADVRGSRLASVLTTYFGKDVADVKAAAAAVNKAERAAEAAAAPPPLPPRARRPPPAPLALPRFQPVTGEALSPDLPRRPRAIAQAYAGVPPRALAAARAVCASPDRARREAVAAARAAAAEAAAGPPPPQYDAEAAAPVRRGRAIGDAFERLAAAQAERRRAVVEDAAWADTGRPGGDSTPPSVSTPRWEYAADDERTPLAGDGDGVTATTAHHQPVAIPPLPFLTKPAAGCPAIGVTAAAASPASLLSPDGGVSPAASLLSGGVGVV